MLTFGWTVLVGIVAIWGVWDWRVAVTGWIVAVISDAVITTAANAASYPDDEGY